MVLEVFTTSNHDVHHTTNVVGSAWNARPTPPWGCAGRIPFAVGIPTCYPSTLTPEEDLHLGW